MAKISGEKECDKPQHRFEFMGHVLPYATHNICDKTTSLSMRLNNLFYLLPDERPPAFYDHFFTDKLSTQYKRPLINDHPANATSDHGNFIFTPDVRPSDRWPAHFLT